MVLFEQEKEKEKEMKKLKKKFFQEFGYDLDDY